MFRMDNHGQDTVTAVNFGSFRLQQK